MFQGLLTAVQAALQELVTALTGAAEAFADQLVLILTNLFGA